MTIYRHHDHHDHGHEHHHHEHEHVSGAEALAILTYMLDHNRHHADELHDIAHSAEPAEAAALLHEAVALFNQANDKLEQALQLMK